MAITVPGDGHHRVTGRFLVAIGKVAEEVTVPVGLPVIIVLQHEGIVGNGDRTVIAFGEVGPGIDHVDGPDGQSFVDLCFLAK